MKKIKNKIIIAILAIVVGIEGADQERLLGVRKPTPTSLTGQVYEERKQRLADLPRSASGSVLARWQPEVKNVEKPGVNDAQRSIAMAAGSESGAVLPEIEGLNNEVRETFKSVRLKKGATTADKPQADRLEPGKLVPSPSASSVVSLPRLDLSRVTKGMTTPSGRRLSGRLDPIKNSGRAGSSADLTTQLPGQIPNASNNLDINALQSEVMTRLKAAYPKANPGHMQTIEGKLGRALAKIDTNNDLDQTRVAEEYYKTARNNYIKLRDKEAAQLITDVAVESGTSLQGCDYIEPVVLRATDSALPEISPEQGAAEPLTEQAEAEDGGQLSQLEIDVVNAAENGTLHTNEELQSEIKSAFEKARLLQISSVNADRLQRRKVISKRQWDNMTQEQKAEYDPIKATIEVTLISAETGRQSVTAGILPDKKSDTPRTQVPTLVKSGSVRELKNEVDSRAKANILRQGSGMLEPLAATPQPELVAVPQRPTDPKPANVTPLRRSASSVNIGVTNELPPINTGNGSSSSSQASEAAGVTVTPSRTTPRRMSKDRVATFDSGTIATVFSLDTGSVSASPRLVQRLGEVGEVPAPTFNVRPGLPRTPSQEIIKMGEIFSKNKTVPVAFSLTGAIPTLPSVATSLVQKSGDVPSSSPASSEATAQRGLTRNFQAPKGPVKALLRSAVDPAKAPNSTAQSVTATADSTSPLVAPTSTEPATIAKRVAALGGTLTKSPSADAFRKQNTTQS